MYSIATMQSFAKPHGATALRVDSFGKLRTGSSLCSGRQMEAKVALRALLWFFTELRFRRKTERF